MLLSTILIVFLSISASVNHAVQVPCGHTDPVCNCAATTIAGDDTCEFTLEIEHLQTFTRYEVDDNGKVGSAGRVWYINDTGTFKQVDNRMVAEKDTRSADPKTDP